MLLPFIFTEPFQEQRHEPLHSVNPSFVEASLLHIVNGLYFFVNSFF